MSEDNIVEALRLFVDALDNAVQVLRRELKSLKSADSKWSWDPGKIKWVETEGTKGLYERYPAKGQRPEGTVDYKVMLEDLKRHQGKLMRGGMFYWVFTDQATVGRKRTKKGNPGPHERMDHSLRNIKKAGQKLTKEQA